MNAHVAQLNLVLAWLWIVVGFGVGFFFGLHFYKERWLGGHASFQRRLYRLAHISFFGLGGVNFLFYLTTQSFALKSLSAQRSNEGSRAALAPVRSAQRKCIA